MNFKELNKFERKMARQRANLSRKERELQQLFNEIEVMREERMKNEAIKILTQPAPEAEAAIPTGGKWWGNGDRMPSPEDMQNPQNLAEILKEYDQLLKTNK